MYIDKEMEKAKARMTVDQIAQIKKQFEKDAIKRLNVQKMDVVVFFDEANTTEAIGLIKEIMCDRRCLGNPVSEELRFIAACNPCRRFVNIIIDISVISYLCEEGLMGRALYIGSRLGGGPIFGVSLSQLDVKELTGKSPMLSSLFE
jgi:hypothetical protein